VPDAPHAALDLAALCQPWTPQTFHARRPTDPAALCGRADTLWNTERRSCVNCAACLAEIERRLAALTK
jgi:hypothetical protein